MSRSSIEFKMAVIQHAIALKRVIRLWDDTGQEAAKAALEGAVSALDQSMRSQQVSVEYRCKACGQSSEVLDWVDNESKCPKCNQELES